MRITKHEHATLTIASGEETLVVDPGSFTAALGGLGRVVGVVVTHEHADHWTPDHLARLAEIAPEAPVFGPEGVARATGLPIRVVGPGDDAAAGSFSLRFFGGEHEAIHSSLPTVDNVGVLVNDAFYYPGDSYALPDGAAIDTLAAPTGAPWLRLGDAMDFILAAKARRVFPTHDLTLSAAGRGMHVSRMAWAAEQAGGELVDLAVGQTVDL